MPAASANAVLEGRLPGSALRHAAAVLAGRMVRSAARLRGGGTALPGLVAERLDPHFIERAFAALPLGVAVISGTNGKTTTTKLVVELLRGQGLTVFTNPSGSNFSRGVASALLGQVDPFGRLEADIAVLELDEAHGARFVTAVRPRYALLLNVFRDQLDRFGEVDTTARYLRAIAGGTTEAVVVNRDDRRLLEIARSSEHVSVRYFGVGPSLLDRFPGDDDLHGRREAPEVSKPPADVRLTAIAGADADYEIGGRRRTVRMRLRGSYNLLNAAAALALVRTILGDRVDEEALVRSLSGVEPAFGRGETIDVDGTRVELVLVKNPAGFRLALGSFDPSGYATAIAINDHENDSRDVSWLWDVDFDRLRRDEVAMVTGIRAAEMVLRLQYDEVEVDEVEPDLRRALDLLLGKPDDRPVRIFCTYTAMLQLRRRLAELTPLSRIDA